METTSSTRTAPVTRPNLPTFQQPVGIFLVALIKASFHWVWATALAFGITLLVMLVVLHPSQQDSLRLVAYLGLGGLVSIALGITALWLIDTLRIGGIRLKIAIPTLLTAFVIAINVLLIAKLMFISPEDEQLLLAFLIFGIAVAILLSSSIAARMTHSIRHIRTGAMRLTEGDYSFRLEEPATSGQDELTELAHWFNQMAGSVQQAFEQQKMAERERKEVIAAVSHDVRTPLASVRAMIEAIDDGIATDPATIQRYHHTIRSELRHLTALLDDLFELSRIESGALTLTRERMSIEDLVSDALEATHEQAEQANITLIGEAENALPAVSIDARQIHRALANLLQNAIRHTPAEGAILIHATSKLAPVPDQDRHANTYKPSIMIQVVDTGEGIAATDLPHIFDRTYRGEASRQRKPSPDDDALHTTSTSAGLGLAITKGIIEAHGGVITAESPLSPSTAALIANLAEVTLTMPGTALTFTLPVA